MGRLISGEFEMGGDLPARVLKWLHKTGYPFEFRIGRRFQAAGWNVNYSRSYRDLDTNKNRELDLQAIVGGVRLNEASVFFSLCLECKTITDKPWVALDSGLTLADQNLLSFALGSVSRTTLLAGAAEGLTPPAPFPEGTPKVGGIVQAFGDAGESAPTSPYAALLQARSAALVLDRDFTALAISAAPRLATASVFLPCVVVDGTLLRYTVAADLSESVDEVDLVVASVPGDAEREASLVAVMTEGFANALAASFFSSAHAFCVAMLPHVSKVAAALKIERLPE